MCMAFTGVLAASDLVLARLKPGESAAFVSHLWVTRSMVADAQQRRTSEMAAIDIGTHGVH